MNVDERSDERKPMQSLADCRYYAIDERHGIDGGECCKHFSRFQRLELTCSRNVAGSNPDGLESTAMWKKSFERRLEEISMSHLIKVPPDHGVFDGNESTAVSGNVVRAEKILRYWVITEAREIWTPSERFLCSPATPFAGQIFRIPRAASRDYN